MEVPKEFEQFITLLNKQIFEGKNEKVTQKKIEGITLFIADVFIGFSFIGEGERK